MRYSRLFGQTLRKPPAGEESKNAQLLEQAGYVQKLAAGVYSYLPLGLAVLEKISQVVREEMNAIEGQEIHMPSLHPKEPWETTGRWNPKVFDVLYKVTDQQHKEWALGPSHEEVVVPLAKTYINSYKDLPLYPYQIQWKFRDELRAKSGLLRGREFLMKDLYSFHTDVNDLEDYYGRVVEAYQKIFQRLGLTAILTEASGGSFSDLSHEFQVETPAGEDTIYYCKACKYTWNKEVIDLAKNHTHEDKSGIDLEERNAAEVGNIFKLYTKYTDPFKLTYKTKDGTDKPVVMGCYGIGITRLMGVIAEVMSDDKGLVWPDHLAPYQAQLIALHIDDTRSGDAVYAKLTQVGISMLYDDRQNVSAGVKFADADMVGLPYRLVVSPKNGDKIEIKKRTERDTKQVSQAELIKLLATT